MPNYLLSFSLNQYQTKIQQNYYRADFLEIFLSIGSIMYALHRVAAKIVNCTGNYTFEKDMMRKLFSMNTDPNKEDDENAMS